MKSKLQYQSMVKMSNYLRSKKINSRSLSLAIIALYVLLAIDMFAANPIRNMEFAFTENRGQVIDVNGNLRPDILYYTQERGRVLYLRNTGMSIVQQKIVEDDQAEGHLGPYDDQVKSAEVLTHRIDMEFVGCNSLAEFETERTASCIKNFYLAHCADGILNVKSFEEVIQKNIYTNIDVRYSIRNTSGIKYDLIVRKGGNPKEIKLSYRGYDAIEVGDSAIRMQTSLGEILEIMPKVYQHINNEVVTLGAKYVLDRDGSISIEVERYNKDYDLYIDPWITYFGGSAAEYTSSIANDAIGNPVFTGYTLSSNFPVLGAYQSVYNNAGIIPYDAYIAKMSTEGKLLWSTYYGGSDRDNAYGICVDKSTNSVYVSGVTYANNFPVGSSVGNTCHMNSKTTRRSAFLIKLSTGGLREWATYFSGTGSTKFSLSSDVALDAFNHPIIVGFTNCNSGLSTNGAFQTTLAGADDFFAAKFNATGSLVWSTYLGGSKSEGLSSVDCDQLGNIFVCGSTGSSDFPVSPGCYQAVMGGGNLDACLVKLDPNGQRLWSTYFGGAFVDYAMAVGTDNSGNVFIGGGSNSLSGIATLGAYQPNISAGGGIDAYLAKFSSAGVRQWATYLGGNNASNIASDYITGIAIDKLNNVVVGGDTYCSDFPVTSCAYQKVFMGTEDQFISTFNSSGGLICSGLIGTGNASSPNNETLGIGGSISVDSGFVYMAAYTYGNYPTTPGSYQQINAGGSDAAISKLCIYSCGLNDTTLQISTSKTNICEGDTINFTSSNNLCNQSNIKYNWWFEGASPSTSTNSNPLNIRYDSSGTFDVQLIRESPCGNDTIFKQDHINVGLIDVMITKSNPTCSMNNGVASAISIGGHTGYSYLWSNGQTEGSISNLSIGTYTVSVNTLGGCSFTDSVTLIAGGGIFVDTIKQASCNSYLFNGQTLNQSGIYSKTLTTYQGCDSIVVLELTIDSVKTTSHHQELCFGNTMLVHGVSRSTTGVYTQTFTSVTGCDSVSQVDLYVHSKITNTLSIVSCGPYSYNGISYSSSGIYSHTYSASSGCDSVLYLVLEVRGQPTSIDTLRVCPYTISNIHGIDRSLPGVYSQTFNSVNGCDSTSTVVLENHPQPVAAFTTVHQSVKITDPLVTIINNSSGANTYQWNFGDNSSFDHGCCPNHIYTDTGTYKIFLYAYNVYGCVDTAVQFIEVKNDFLLYIPNAFTPNDDLHNGTFGPKASGIKEYKMWIFDRWGKELWQSSSMGDAWDGKSSLTKNPVQQGVYVWLIRLTDDNGIQRQFTGHVTLLR